MIVVPIQPVRLYMIAVLPMSHSLRPPIGGRGPAQPCVPPGLGRGLVYRQPVDPMPEPGAVAGVGAFG